MNSSIISDSLWQNNNTPSELKKVILKIFAKSTNNFQGFPFQQEENGQHGYLQLDISYENSREVLTVTIISARGLTCRDFRGTRVQPSPFVKIYLLPGKW